MTLIAIIVLSISVTTAVVMFSEEASAHPPGEVTLSYDWTYQRLSVIITHITPAPNYHYINRTDIYVNDLLFLTQNYTSQPELQTFTYDYNVPAEDGDVITVDVTCSISGTTRETITVKEPSIDLVLDISPDIDKIKEGGSRLFTVEVTSNGTAVEGATLEVTAEHGTISQLTEIFEGRHEFNYDAPEEGAGLEETITVTATKEEYNGSVEHIRFQIVDGDVETGNLNGEITQGEYDSSVTYSTGDLEIHWKVEGDNLKIALKGRTTGWLSIGFDPTSAMKDADMLIGWVGDDTSVEVFDAYSTGDYGPHPPDTELGGTDDIAQFGGTELAGWTTLEFIRPLDTGDQYDKDLSDTTDVKIIWGMGDEDEYDSPHTDRGSGTIQLTVGGNGDEFPDPTLDGVITPGEYEHDFEFDSGNYILHWRFTQDEASIAMRAKTRGWVAIGFEPSGGMKGADMIIGWVDTEVYVMDAYAEDEQGAHPADTSLGGTMDLLEVGGKESGDWTVIEFRRKVDTGDSRDRTLDPEGRNTIIWAYGASDDPTANHGAGKRGTAEVNWETGEVEEVPELWPIHAFLMVLGLILIGSGISIARFMKKKAWWMKAHKYINIGGAVSVIAGLIIGAYMIESAGRTHLSGFHHLLGAITILSVIAVPILGQLIFKGPSDKRPLFRKLHVWIGRAAVALMVLTSLSGLFAAGVL